MIRLRTLTFLLFMAISSWVMAQTTVTLNPTKDNTLYESATGILSNGAGAAFIAGQTNNSSLLRRGLLKFDLSSIPSNATITNVQLDLTVVKTSSGGKPVSLHKVNQDWGEGTSDEGGTGPGSGNGAPASTGDATWLHTFSNTATWTTVGGDYSSVASASLSVAGLGSYTWTGAGLVTDVQSWLANSTSNHGWIVIGDETSNKTTKHFGSKENTTASNRPELKVTYTVPTPLVGVYTIGSTNPDYPTFAAAIADLNTLGVSGAVTFNVDPGTYMESLTLTEVAGASATNTITFNGMDKSMVTITHDGAIQEATVAFDGADYITFKNITVANTKMVNDAWGFHFRNQADNNTIDSCSVNMAMLTAFADIACVSASGSLTSSSSGSDNFNNLTVSNTHLFGGYYGLRTEASTFNDTGLVVMNCIVEDNIGFGISVDEAVDVTISGNHVFGDSLTSKDGLNFDDIVNFTITGNTVNAPDYALELDDGNFGTTYTGRSLIANNMLLSTGEDAMNLDDINDIDVFHNTCLTTTTSAGRRALRFNDDVGLVIKNNIFVVDNGIVVGNNNQAVWINDIASNAVFDHNIYYTQDPDFISYGGSPITSYADLAAWQAAYPMINQNSIQGKPTFVSTTDLHINPSDGLANDVGDNTLGVMTDIDGDMRPSAASTTVDIGADEYDFVMPSSPTVVFNNPMVAVEENVGSVTVTIDINNPTATATSVDVMVDMASTAMSGMDYTFTNPTTVTFPANSSMSQTVSVAIIDDMLFEMDETIILKLTNATNGAMIGTDSVHTITINVNDPVVSKDLILTGVMDGPLLGGTPKGIELYVKNNIPDLSVFGLGSANNGGGTDGQEFTFPAVAATAGQFIYVATDTAQFANFFGFSADYEGGSATGVNGDDAVELFENGFVIDVFGDINVDGTGQPWEYLDTWAYRNCGTGPDSTVFQLGSWSFAPLNNFDAQTSNATSPVPMPIGTYSMTCPAPDPYSLYTIAQVHGEDAAGAADSSGVLCELRGVVYGVDLDGNTGLSFTLIDPTGGIGIFNFNDINNYVVTEGDSIHARGTISQFNGLTQLTVDSIVVASAGNTLKMPTVVTALDETTESDLIRLNNLTLVTPSQWPTAGNNSNVDVTDGTNTYTVRIDRDTDVDGSPAPTGTFDIIGIGGQFDNSSPYDAGYQLLPRYIADVLPQMSATPTVSFSGSAMTVQESAGTVTIDVMVASPNAMATSVDVSVGMASTAMSGMDYTFTSPTTVTFPANSTMPQMVSITIIDDAMVEGAETIVLELSNATNGAMLGTDSVYTLTIDASDAPVTKDLIITGVMDGPLLGGTPKVVEIYVKNNIADLSAFGLGSANNGGGTDGQEFTFPAVAATAGQFIYVATDTAQFTNFFGFSADYDGGFATGINGDDAVELFEQGFKIDVFGDINVDGSGQPWDYLDGWAYRKCSTDNDTTFNLNDWIFSGINVLDGETSNATAATPFPNGTYSTTCPLNPVANDDMATTDKDMAVTVDVLSNDNVPNALDSIVITMQPMNGMVTVNGVMDITYTPNAGYCGMDMFDYAICDLTGCDTATVTIEVICPPDYPYYPIATVHTEDGAGAADSLAIDCELRGVVHATNTRPSGLQFTLIDPTGGINVFSFNPVSNYTVTEGDSIHVWGVIDQFNGLTEIIPDSILLVSTGNALEAVNPVTALDESTESRLVQLINVTLVDPAQWTNSGSGFNVDVTDGTNTYTVRIDNDVNIFGTPAPAVAVNITGIGGQFDNSSPYDEGYQLLPRYLADIVPYVNTQEVQLAGKVRFFPNPANSTLQIRLGVDVDMIRITNVLGQETITFNNPRNEELLDVSTLADGVYFISFISEGVIYTEELVIRK